MKTNIPKTLMQSFNRYQLFWIWCLFAIPGGIVAAIVMYVWAHVTGLNPWTMALGGFLGIALSFPVIGFAWQSLEDWS